MLLYAHPPLSLLGEDLSPFRYGRPLFSFPGREGLFFSLLLEEGEGGVITPASPSRLFGLCSVW